MDVFGNEAADLLAQRDPSSDPVTHFNDTLRLLLDRHAPPIPRHVPHRPHAPWFCETIVAAKRDRRKAERAWRSSGLEVHRQIYKEKKLLVKKAITSAKTEYMNDRILQASNPKELFCIMSDLLGSSSSTPLPTIYNSDQLPDLFSTFFIDKIAQIRSTLDQTPFIPSPPSPSFTGTPLAAFKPVTVKEVSNMIQKMKIKTCELDPLPAVLLSGCIHTLLPAITDIINTSLSTGIFPDSLKPAFVRPLLKKNNLDPNELKNYRPVSNLSFLSKLLERIVLHQLSEHLSVHSLLPNLQSAYRPQHSTETALLRITSDLRNAMDNGEVSALVLLDLSAAFDTIDHNILIQRLRDTFGIHSSALSWFQTYLRDRTQTVAIDAHLSEPAILSFGVPQGSVLGPVLFTLYTQPIPHVIERHNLLHHSFADDTELYNSTKPENINSLLSSISNCFSDIKNWMTENKLKLNGDKTEALLIGTKQKLSAIPDASLLLSDATVPLSTQVKSLGVILDSTLSMQPHIASLTKACFFQLRRIASIRRYLTQDACIKLVICLILSRLDYCNSLLANVPASSLQRLQRIQNSAARLILCKKKRDHITPLFHFLHWLPIKDRITYKLCTLCHKCVNKAAPAYLCSCVQLYTPSRPLRSAADTLTLNTPLTKLKTAGQRAFTFSGPSAWNALPLALRVAPLDDFKGHLKTYLFRQRYHQ
jgi:hypothetical protein